MADYMTDDERRAARAKASRGIEALKKEREEQNTKLRAARKAKEEANKKAREATLAANKQSATFPHPAALYVAPLAGAVVATAVSTVDGRIGSKEDVTAWVTAGIGLIGTVGSALLGSPTAALSFSTLFTGGLSSAGTRRGRAWGEKMRAEAG